MVIGTNLMLIEILNFEGDEGEDFISELNYETALAGK